MTYMLANRAHAYMLVISGKPASWLTWRGGERMSPYKTGKTFQFLASHVGFGYSSVLKRLCDPRRLPTGRILRQRLQLGWRPKVIRPTLVPEVVPGETPGNEPGQHYAQPCPQGLLLEDFQNDVSLS